MTDIFRNLCEAMTDAKPKFENIDKPFRDIAQETWVQYLERLERIPDARTFEELVQVFGEDAPLLATIYRARSIDHYRMHRGQKQNSPHKSQLLREAFSLDGFDDKGEPWSEIIEDSQGELPFRHIEELDLITRDERITTLPTSHQDAIKRFVIAWFMIENGYTLPNSVSKRIARDRKMTGLPLVLPKGPRGGTHRRRNPPQKTNNYA